ncbi:acyl-CoA dehydrogenase family protein [Plesiocystis pacifica SIR-1]|uniref:Acyl-CoA dehydrogenase family protein n=1 Tax=Plesiocystis pacifica SIR-1 TaxID=391625 RepID=A6G1Z0_9BACT|nr:acyl-CoA dehydrogenase [Plesiocystis pacifica]EDM80180.1 acyl-CoA dehydrogenase family protein [Plesiocystis pacifica SIR-1]
MAGTNPLIRDRDVDFQLYEVHDAEQLCKLPHFAEHTREIFDLWLRSAAKLAREQFYPAFKPMDEKGAELIDGRIKSPEGMAELFDAAVDLGLITAARPESVGGSQLPLTVSVVGYLYLMAGNSGAVGYPLLTAGAAHLIESFGSEALKATFMKRMYAGEWVGTMSLTEPGAGSGLGDITSTATPIEGREAEGAHHIRGSKIFISGGDLDFRDNIVHLTLARRPGDPPGVKGISLFAVPRLRPSAGLEDPSNEDAGEGEIAVEFNDVHTSQLIHKIGWKGLPSLGLSYGEADDCVGWIVGEPCRGLSYMFQMMNEARILVGANGTATASAAYHQSVDYARERKQGRSLDPRQKTKEPIPIIEHPDVKRMLLRQKAIVEASMCLVMTASRYNDVAEHGANEGDRKRARMILDILTPITKTFPAERGFESTSLALQIHGGYGYSSEYLPELWFREQRLNSIHEGTTTIQGLDLLGRKVVANMGQSLMVLMEEIRADIEVARKDGVDEALCEAVKIEVARVGGLTQVLGQRGMSGDVLGMMAHSHDYLCLFSNFIVAWQWLRMAGAASRGLTEAHDPDSEAFYRAKLEAARYWIRTELPDNARLAELCESNEDSYLKVPDSAW